MNWGDITAMAVKRRAAMLSSGVKGMTPLRWRIFVSSLSIFILFCLVPFPHNPRSLSLLTEEKGTSSSRSVVRAAPKLPSLITPSTTTTPPPAIVTYPDTNRTYPDSVDYHERRPYFILHVGPPKTATTTLQTEMTKYGKQLRQDNYVYLGQIMRNSESIYDHWHSPLLRLLKDRGCQKAVNAARIAGTSWPKCWLHFLEILQDRRDEGRSVIISEEDFAIKYQQLDGLGRVPFDWIALKMALEEQGWEPIVVVGYRRLYDIMPSAKQQWDQWTRNNDGLALWPPKGRTLQPLFPGVLKDSRLYDDYVPRYIPRTIQWSYTDHLIESISPHFPVRLLNMHDPLSIRSTFVCRVLPYAENACTASQSDDAQKEELHRNSEQSLFYDAIATEAADREWFDKDLFDRHQVGIALRNYYEDEMGGNPKNLPLLCPNNTQLELLLERSLVKEEQILTRKVAETMLAAHIAGFWKSVESHKFCWIDVDKTLEEPHWKDFFRSIVPDDDQYYEYYEEKEDEAREEKDQR